MNPDFWTILASVSQAAAALGTFLTVLVATRQWRRQWQPRLQISVDVMFTVPRGAPRQHFVQVEVVNVGIRSVIVGHLLPPASLGQGPLVRAAGLRRAYHHASSGEDRSR